MNSNSREGLNGAQRASGYQVSVAGVTAGDGNTHDFRAAVERPYLDRRRCRRKYILFEISSELRRRYAAGNCLATPSRFPFIVAL